MNRNILSIFLEKIKDFPIYVKQAICLSLSDDIKAQVCNSFLEENANNIFSLYEPILTYKGKEELSKQSYDLNIHNFLSYCEKNCSILEISLNTFLSLEEVSKYFILCLEQNYIEKPENIEIEAMAGFISGKFRTGEYFVQKGLITEPQLEKAIKIRNKSQKKFAQILLDLGFITQEDISKMLAFKEDSKKRFILDYNSIPKNTMEFCKKEDYYLKTIENLKEENLKLKEKLNNLLEMMKNND